MKVLGRTLGAVLLAGVAALGCRPPADTPPDAPEPEMPPWFADVSREVGLDFVHRVGPLDRYFMPYSVGSGGAFFDYDGDGRLDVYLVQNGGPDGPKNRLFHQEPDGTFRDASKGSGLDVAGYGMGVAVGDFDNDGWPDVLVTEYGRVRLFHNNGDGKTFTDVTVQAGLDNPQWATSAAFFDYDRDGWLDLIIVNYIDYDPTKVCRGGGRIDFCGPKSFGGSVARLYHNRGRAAGGGAVSFADVTLASGLARLPGPGLGVVAADFDGDGWPDVMVTNDAQPNRLWINQHDGTFKDEAIRCGLAFNGLGQQQGNMGVALGDIDGSGRCAVFVTHMTNETNTLWRQEPRGLFRDATVTAGLTGSRWRGTGFGTVFGDFDNDGALDLAVVNGRVVRADVPPEAPTPPGMDPFWLQYAERNQLFAGDGTGRFRDLSPRQLGFCGCAAVWRSVAVGDVNNDGGLDLLVTAVGGPARLYRNVVPARGHWLVVRAVDPALKRDAYGAEVTVEAGGRRRVAWINPGQSYLCSNDPRAHFGLGSAGRIEGIQVRWPDGTAERFGGGPADRVVVLRRGEGKGDPTTERSGHRFVPNRANQEARR
jgi:hypothetical protein